MQATARMGRVQSVSAPSRTALARSRRLKRRARIAAVYLLLPEVPMIFMGEEWNASQPFQFFCDFLGKLGDLVREGRRQEFATFPEFKDRGNVT
jgi:1,4-alpha-glucan branching enzyme